MHRLLISIVEGFRLAFQALRANKVRAILTSTCIVIGIVSVTSMNTMTDGVDRSFDASMEMLGRDVLFVDKWPWGVGGGEYKWWEYRNRREMQLSYADDIKRLAPSVVETSASAYRSTSIRYQDRMVDRVPIGGATASIFQTRNMNIDQGRAFTEDEVARAARVAIMGGSVTDALFPGEDPIGKEVRIRGQRFQVIGTFERRGNFLGLEDTDNNVIIPITTFGTMYSLRWGIQIAVQFESEEAMYEGEYELIGAMRQIRGLDPLDDDDFAINKAALFEREFKSMKTRIYWIGMCLTGLALIVGGIGVMNIMFVSVKERTKEIGIRKAVGAKSWEILFQFLIESVVICFVGGLVGVLISLGVTALINQFFVAYMDWVTVVQAVLICTAVGILFGFLPSNRAAKSNPIESLRYE